MATSGKLKVKNQNMKKKKKRFDFCYMEEFGWLNFCLFNCKNNLYFVSKLLETQKGN